MIEGTSGDDEIYINVKSSDRAARGYAGNDVIVSNIEEGQVALSGEDGNDYLQVSRRGSSWGELMGGNGNDWLVGSIAADRLWGGDGHDLMEAASPGDASVGDFLYGGAGSDGLYGSSGDDKLYGGDGDDGGHFVTLKGFSSITTDFHDGLFGGAGNDLLDGGSGADYMAGGTGDDIYYLDKATDVIFEEAGEGTDTVIAGANYGPWSSTFIFGNVENIQAASGKNYLYLAGNDLDNTVTGNELNDILFGGEGKDLLRGNAGNDRLTGNSDADRLEGGTGDDIYIFYYNDFDPRDVIVEKQNEGSDTVFTENNFKLAAGVSVENLSVFYSAHPDERGPSEFTLAINLTGNELDQTLWGGGGADVLYGEAGNDSLIGGAGNDTLNGGAGTDTAVYSGKRSDYAVVATATTVTVTDKRTATANDGKDTLTGIEKLTFSDGTIGTPVNAAPRSLALTSAVVTEKAKVGTTVGTLSAIDPEKSKLTYKLLDSAGGLFKISGNKLLTTKAIDYEKIQSDTVKVEVSDGALKVLKTFTITVKDVMETIGGTSKANTLKGGIGADKLLGGAGNDTLTGGKGFDDLYGGTGKDTFVFKALSDFGTSKTATDTIFDFSHKESDRIGLSAIDASTKSSGNNAFSFIGSNGWHKKAGELRYDKAKSDTYVYGDVNGDGKADFVLHLDDAITLKAGDFIL